MSATANLLERLLNELGPQTVVTDPEIVAPHLQEWRGRGAGSTPFMVFPTSTADVARIVVACGEAGVAITPQGGNTGLVGGQIPQGEVLLSLTRMRAVRDVDAASDTMTAEAGATLSQVHDAAHAVGRRFPLRLASEGSATIGGLISTNAGGVHVLRFGMMRELVLGIEAVLPDGSVFQGLRSLRKDNTGYDLKQLFIGAEGTLGVVTAATLRLFPNPAARTVALAAVGSAHLAVELLHLARDQTGALTAFEIMNQYGARLAAQLPGVRMPFDAPWLALMEFESPQVHGLMPVIEAMLQGAIEKGAIADAVVAQSESDVAEFWALRELMSAGHRSVGRPQVSHDTSTPVSAIPRFLSEADAAVERLSPGSRTVAFGHAGDGNIHYTAIAPSAEAYFPAEAISQAIHDIATRLGGSISAEHGIGVFRKAELQRFKDPAALQTMRTIKRALDPRRILNPRVLFE